jgi:hypothetical protein
MNRIRKSMIGAALVASTVAGGAVGAALVNSSAGAQSDTTTTAPAAGAPADRPSFDPAKGGHVGANGLREELLTGDTAEKVKSAALAAVPRGTIERVETDAEGSPYEAHMTTADAKHVTVKVDSSFKVTDTEAGPGPR